MDSKNAMLFSFSVLPRTLRSLVLATALAAAVTTTGIAFAGDPQGFIQGEQTKLSALLRQAPSAQRDGQVSQLLDATIDYDEVARRAFGQPCPAAIPACTNHWGALTDAQRSEVTGLLKQLVAKNYKKNLLKTLDYDVTYKGERASNGETTVRTEAKSKVNQRDPAVQVDYVVKDLPNGTRIVDIVTEHSSLTKNYYDSFHRYLTTDGEGYPKVVSVLQKNIAKP